MDLQVQHLGDGIHRVALVGRLDSAAVGTVDHGLSALTATQAARVLVDLSGVSFLSSMGIRSLLTNARALRQRGGSMALLSPQSVVEQVLRVTRIDAIIPIFHDLEAATAALGVTAPGA